MRSGYGGSAATAAAAGVMSPAPSLRQGQSDPRTVTERSLPESGLSRSHSAGNRSCTTSGIPRRRTFDETQDARRFSLALPARSPPPSRPPRPRRRLATSTERLRQTVARIFLSVSGRRFRFPPAAATTRRLAGGGPQRVPMTLGDRIYTGSRSRIELAGAGRRHRPPGSAHRLRRSEPDRRHGSGSRCASGIASFTGPQPVRVRHLGGRHPEFRGDLSRRPATTAIDVDDQRRYARVFVRQGRRGRRSPDGSQIPVEAGPGDRSLRSRPAPATTYVRVSS